MKYFLLLTTFINILLSSTLNLSIGSSPSRINPILSNDTASSEISQWIFNGLLKYDKDGNPTVDLASSYKFETPTKLIIKMKKGVLWHDGVEVTSKDVIFTYEKIIDPDVYVSFRSNFNEVQSVKAIDKYTVEIIFKKPYFKALVTWMVSLLPEHILKNEKNLMTSQFNKKPIGTGPYKLKEFKNNADIELVANDNYFEGRPKIDKILYKFIPDTNTSFLFLKQRKLDLGGLTPLQYERQLDKKFKEYFKTIEKPAFSYSYLGFNLRDKKFQNKKLRQAIAYATNRKELIDILYFGHGEICDGPFAPNSLAFDEKFKPYRYNLKKAKKLLKELGYDKNNPFSFEVVTNTGNTARANAAQILQHQLKKANIHMSIKVMEWQAFLNTIVTPRKFEAILLGWTTTLMPDAYALWHSNSDKLGRFNLVGYRNKRIDELIDKGAGTINRKEFAKIYKEIYSTIADDLPYLFLYIPNSISAINKNIKNIKPTPISILHNQIEWEKP